MELDPCDSITMSDEQTKEKLNKWLEREAHSPSCRFWFCLSRDLLVFDHIRDGGYFSNVRDDDKVEGHIRRALAEMNGSPSNPVAP